MILTLRVLAATSEHSCRLCSYICSVAWATRLVFLCRILTEVLPAHSVIQTRILRAQAQQHRQGGKASLGAAWSRAVPVWRECIQTLTGLTESFDSSFLYEC